MLDTIASVLLNIFCRWADRPVVRVKVERLEYDLSRNDPDSGFVFITPYPSQYHAEIAFSHRGKAATIKGVTLIVNNDIKLLATGFNPLKLQHGDYHKETVSFPVEENSAVKEGTFEILAVDAFDKVVHRCRGRFPIVPNL